MLTETRETPFQQALDVAASIGTGDQGRGPVPGRAADAPVAVATLHQPVAQGVVAALGTADLLEVSDAALKGWARQAARSAISSPLLLVDASASEGGMLAPLREALPSLQIILIFEELEREQLDRLLNCSARGCVSRYASVDDLVRAVQGVRAGQLWVPRAWLTALYELAAGAWVPCELGKPPCAPDAGGDRPDLPLTDRELGAIELAHQGLTNKEIARRLHISGSTVKKHLAHAYEKLGIRHRRQLYSARS